MEKVPQIVETWYAAKAKNQIEKIISINDEIVYFNMKYNTVQTTTISMYNDNVEGN